MTRTSDLHSNAFFAVHWSDGSYLVRMEIGGAVENAFGADIKKRTKAAEQAVIARAQANKWTGDWVPIEVSPTTGAAIPYTKEGETSTPPNQRPLSAWKGLRFLLMFPDDPRQVSVELAEQLLGLRPR